MKIKIPGINAEKGLELCDGDLGTFVQSLRLYITNLPKALKNMQNVSESTLHDYFINAHTAKSISGYVGAEEVIQTAKQLEAMAKSGDLSGVLAQNEAFLKTAENLVDNIREWLENYDALSR